MDFGGGDAVEAYGFLVYYVLFQEKFYIFVGVLRFVGLMPLGFVKLCFGSFEGALILDYC